MFDDALAGLADVAKAKAKGQPRIPKGDPRRGRIHPGEFANNGGGDDGNNGGSPKPRRSRAKGVKPPGRKDSGARGRAGAPAPPKAPIHDNTLAGYEKGSEAWHRAARGLLKDRGNKMRAAYRAQFPAVHKGAGFHCKSCGSPYFHPLPVIQRGAKEGEWQEHPTLMMRACARCGTAEPAHVATMAHAKQTAELDPMKRAGFTLDVVKTIDTSQTALQAQGAPAGSLALVGHRTQCPRGGNAPCGAEVDGRCSLCDAVVRDHEAIGKTIADITGVLHARP